MRVPGSLNVARGRADFCDTTIKKRRKDDDDASREYGVVERVSDFFTHSFRLQLNALILQVANSGSDIACDAIGIYEGSAVYMIRRCARACSALARQAFLHKNLSQKNDRNEARHVT